MLQLFSHTSAMGVGFSVNLKNNIFHFILFGYNLTQTASWDNMWMLAGVSISLIGNFIYVRTNQLRTIDDPFKPVE